MEGGKQLFEDSHGKRRMRCISKFANSFQRIGRLAHVWDTGARMGLLPDAARLFRMHWDPLGSIGIGAGLLGLDCVGGAAIGIAAGYCWVDRDAAQLEWFGGHAIR